MKNPLMWAIGLITAVCLFGPTPADAGVGVDVNVGAAPVAAPYAAPACAQPQLAPSCAQPAPPVFNAPPVAPPVMTYQSPPTRVRVPGQQMTVQLPDQEYEVPGQTYTIQAAPACAVPAAAPMYAPAAPVYAAPSCATAAYVPTYAPAYAPPPVNVDVDVPPRGPLRALFHARRERLNGNLNGIEDHSADCENCHKRKRQQDERVA